MHIGSGANKNVLTAVDGGVIKREGPLRPQRNLTNFVGIRFWLTAGAHRSEFDGTFLIEFRRIVFNHGNRKTVLLQRVRFTHCRTYIAKFTPSFDLTES